MQTIFRSGLVLVLLARLCGSLCAQSAGTFDDLYDALYNGATGTSITLSKDITGNMEYGFIPDPSDPMGRNVIINTGGYKINYSQTPGDETEFWFYISEGEKLTFNGNATISGGYLSDSLFFVDVPFLGSTGGSLIFNNNANLHNNVGMLGAAVNLAGNGTLTITGDATFKDNFSEGDGGAVYASVSTVNITNIVAEGNNAVTSGGVFYVDSDSTVTISKGATFTGNGAGYDEDGIAGSGSGGVAYVTGTDTKIQFTGTETITFNTNKAADSGGALYIDSDGSVTFANKTVEFLNNVAENDGGGAVYLNGGTLTFTNATDGSSLKFENNKTDLGSGGALSVTDSIVNFNAKTIMFRLNTANDSSSGGGAIYAAGDTKLTFAAGTTTTFTSNASDGDGGAVYLTGAGVVDPDPANVVYGWDSLGTVNFTNNEAAGNGGGLYTDTSAMQFGNVTFSNNRATGDGGAIFVDGSYIVFNGTTSITNNTAANGGAFALSNDAVISFNENSSITNNSATTSGGAIYVFDGGESTVQVAGGKTLTISDNSAAQGGAIFVADSSNLVLNTAGTGATINITAATTGKANDVYIDDGTLTLDIAAGSKIVINSELSSNSANTVELFKTGAGTAYIDGKANGYAGNVTAEEGNLYIGKGGTFGDQANTMLNFTGGCVIIDVNSASSNVAASFKEITFDTSATSPQLLFLVHDEEEIKLIELAGDDYTNSDFDTWMSAGYIDTADSSFTFTYRVDDNPNDPGNSSILYITATYDADNQDWTFNNDFTLKNAVLNNNLPSNTGKKITVNNDATLTLNNGDNFAGSLNGTGNVVIGTGKSLTLNGSTNATLGGDVTGGGDLIMDGNFTQKIGGDIGVDLDINRGTVAVADGEMTGNLTGSSNGTFLVDGTTVDQGGIKDTYFKIIGDTNEFTGKTKIDSGWLLIDGSNQFAKSSEITVGANGGLGGYGTIGGVSGVTVKNGGAIQAYDGDLNVAGMLTFESGGQLYLVAAGNSSHVISADSVRIDNGAKLVIANVVNSYTGGKFQFVESNDIEGSFNNPAYYKTTGGTEWTFTISEEGNGLWVNGTASGVSSNVPGLSWNQGQVVKGLSNGGPALEAFITDLNNNHRTDLGGGNFEYDTVYQKATQQLAGASRLNSLQFGLYSPYRTVFNRLQSRDIYVSDPVYYEDGYDYDPAEGYGPVEGMEGIGAGAADDPTYRGQMGGGMYNPHLIDEASIGCDPCASVAMTGERRFWADVTHVQTKAHSDGNSSRYGISRTGLLLGMDHQKTGDTRIGSLFGYFAPYLWQDSDRIEADDYHFGMYFQKQRLGTEFYGYLGYAHQEISSSRYIDVSAVDGSVPSRYTGQTSGNSFLMNFEISKPRYYGSNLVARPLIGLDYYYTSQNGFAENGAGIFGLRYDRANYDQLFLRFGMNFKAETVRSSKMFRIQYINQVGGTAYPDSVSHFVSGGTPMNIRGVNLGHDYLNLGFGLNVFRDPTQNRFLSFDYDANMSRRMTSHGISLIYMKKF